MRFRDLYGDDLQLCLLSPRAACVPCDDKCVFSAKDYETRLTEIQALRGEVYLADGAITRGQLNVAGGYATPFDHEAWHVYVVAKDKAVLACCTFMLHRKGVTVEELRVHELIEGIEAGRRELYHGAIQEVIDETAQRGVRLGEAAAWAVHESIRNRCASLTVALAAWPLYRMLGGALVIGAPTLRHHTASIEKRLGGTPMSFKGVPLGAFHDPGHGCDMELVWFDSERPVSRFVTMVQEFGAHFEKLTACGCRERSRAAANPAMALNR